MVISKKILFYFFHARRFERRSAKRPSTEEEYLRKNIDFDTMKMGLHSPNFEDLRNFEENQVGVEIS